ncbi:MAG: aminopeptidase P family protein [Deltaproteobacteria bacterium]|nr:aminopeptidase P family protein [Deltaproteobacteria bacterium]
MNLEAIQAALDEFNIGGWLFFDFGNRDPISYRVLGLPNKHASRRWYYMIPAHGEPVKLAHRVEPGKLDSLPGKKVLYSSWKEMGDRLAEMVLGLGTVAMQYSPDCSIPYISVVDGGTVELVRSKGVEVVSSADLVQRFEGLVDEAGYETHVEAGRKMHLVLEETWKEIAARINAGKVPNEVDVQKFMLDGFTREGLTWDGTPPIVGVDEHAADPHFEPRAELAKLVEPGHRLLIDLWTRLDQEDAIYYDITWCAQVGSQEPDPLYREVFDVVMQARDKAVAFIGERLEAGHEVHGYEVDDVCRGVVTEAGYGEYFVHRTGHSIGREVHGNGANIDNLETQDRRRLVPGAMFSIEPGIYLYDRKIGVRTEIDVYISAENRPVIYGPVQKELVVID